LLSFGIGFNPLAMAPVSFVDVAWLRNEGAELTGAGVPKRPLVVGGSGLIGHNLWVLLASTPGCERVRIADVNPPSPLVLEEVDESKIEFVKHKLGSESSDALADLVKGCDCVFSVVTPHVQLGTTSEFFKTNVEGVESLVKACEAAGIKRLVFTSSIATSNHFVASINQDEKYPLPPIEIYESPYDITKRKGEELVLGANNLDGLKTVALRPGGVLLSPTDFTFRNLFIFRGLLAGPKIESKIDFIDGRDLCRALVMAAKALDTKPKEVAGQAFWTTKGEAMNPDKLCELANEVLNWYVLSVPTWVVYLSMFCASCKYYVVRGLSPLLGLRVPGVPPHRFIAMAFVEKTFDNSKAERLLGYKPKISMVECVTRIAELHKKSYE
jgi:sterol-4alpha-carboxylate 3-dehydrogenase (decarboxylating)